MISYFVSVRFDLLAQQLERAYASRVAGSILFILALLKFHRVRENRQPER